MNRIIESMEIDSYYLNTDNWSSVFIDNLTEQQKEIYINRKKAIDLYMQNEMLVNDICQLTGVKRHHLVNLIRKCLTTDSNGTIWGYRALIPYKRTKSYSLNEFPVNDNSRENKTAGTFQLLLNRHPNIQELIYNLYLRKGKEIIHESRISVKNLHKRFLDACRSAGIKPTEYPFNTSNLAKRSLERYVKKLELQYFNEGVRRYGDHAISYAKSTGIGEQNHPMIIRPFERVQFDGHRIDTMISVVFTTPEGDEIIEVMNRIWILAIIDVGTRAILGYHLCLNKEYSSYDVLTCIKNAIVPKLSMPITIPALTYNEMGGFVSEKLPDTKWALWDEFLLDNAKANLSSIVRDRLTSIVGCGINAGPVSVPVRRSLIERFFLSLEENGFHRLPSTTGSNPSDPRRRSPEEKAIKYHITLADLEQLIEVMISNYNGTPNSGINNLTPLEVMEQRIAKGYIPRVMPTEKRTDISFFSMTVNRPLKGDITKGKRPYINFEGVEYRNDIATRMPELIGTKLDLLINTDDIRFVKAFLPDGSELGIFTATGKWGVVPHTLQVRKQINKLKRERQLHFTIFDDPIETYLRYLESDAKNKKISRNKMADLKRQKSNKEVLRSSLVEDTPAEDMPTESATNLNAKNDNNLRRFKTIIY